jgi:hypothetical protein
MLQRMYGRKLEMYVGGELEGVSRAHRGAEAIELTSNTEDLIAAASTCASQPTCLPQNHSVLPCRRSSKIAAA